MMREILTWIGKDRRIEKCAKKQGHIIHGSAALRRQMGVLNTRKPADYDMFAKNPKEAADKMQSKLDKDAGGDYYYVKKSKHPGTFKVAYNGYDKKRGTKDDVSFIDFTKPDKYIYTKKIGGINYRNVEDIRRSKVASVRDPQYSYRHDKDKADLKRIKNFKRLRRI